MITVHTTAILTRDVAGDLATIPAGTSVTVYGAHGDPHQWFISADGFVIPVERDPSLVATGNTAAEAEIAMIRHLLGLPGSRTSAEVLTAARVWIAANVRDDSRATPG